MLSAAVWNECLALAEKWFSVHTQFAGFESWLDKQLSKRQELHSQSIQAVRKRFCEAYRSYFTHRRDGNKEARPPTKQKRSYTTRWLKSAIRFDEDNLTLKLSTGKNGEPLYVVLPDSFDFSKVDLCQTVDLCERYGQWELHFTYRGVTLQPKPPGDGVLAIDIGEIHPMVAHDGTETTLCNGRYIRSLYQLRNKVIAEFQALLAQVEKYSPEYRRLVQRKWKKLNRIDRQINDCLHKHTAAIRKICLEKGIGTVVIGDLKNIRRSMKYGRKANQKLHQWTFARIAHLLTYKLEAVGIRVESMDEAYTSQTCPCCGDRYKPRNRNYHCRGCGFRFHRDGVGAINIRKKYLGEFHLPVAAAMAPPRGIRIGSRLPK